jgi:hypothetical protein
MAGAATRVRRRVGTRHEISKVFLNTLRKDDKWDAGGMHPKQRLRSDQGLHAPLRKLPQRRLSEPAQSG